MWCLQNCGSAAIKRLIKSTISRLKIVIVIVIDAKHIFILNTNKVMQLESLNH